MIMLAQKPRVPLLTIPRHSQKAHKLMCTRDLTSVHSIHVLDSLSWSSEQTVPGGDRAIPERPCDSERSPMAGLAAGGPFDRSQYRSVFRRQWTLHVVQHRLTGLRPEESRMLRFRQTLIVAAIAAALSVPGSYAQAQRGRSGRGGAGAQVGPVGTSGLILSLARYPIVQAELKLEGPQKQKIQALAESSSQRQRQFRDQMNPRGQSGQAAAPGGNGGQNGGRGPGGQGNARMRAAEMAEHFAAMREAQMVLDQDIEQAVASILDRGQYRRLKQIQLQVEGIGAGAARYDREAETG